MQIPVGVYYSHQDFRRDEPAFFVDRETARLWLRQKGAWSIHHGRDIALSPEMAQQIAREAIENLELQQSLVMGESVMRANADSELWAVRLTRGWNPRIALAEHQISLRRYQEFNKVS